MTKQLALVRIENGEVLGVFQEGAGIVPLPGAGQVSPPVLGWEGGGELITTEGPPRFRLVEYVPAEIAEGKQATGPASREYDGKVVREVIPVEGIPPPPAELTRAQKLDALLAAAGLTRADLKAELAG